MNEPRKAVVLLSGGLDSSTTLAVAKAQGFDLYALTFRYGQRHEVEFQAARAVAQSQGVRSHEIATIDLGLFGGSALTDDIEVPKDRTEQNMASGIPVTYVPARNLVFLSYALAYAEALGACDLFIGVNAVDYSGYPDCRPEFIEAFEKLANLATKAGVEGERSFKIHAPLLHLSKKQIIRQACDLKVDLSLTRTCYDPDDQGRACGHCDACLLRLKGFSEAGLVDPAPYRENP